MQEVMISIRPEWCRKIISGEKTLEIRKGPGMAYGRADRKCLAGIYTIVEVKNGWGRLKSGAGWLQLKGTEKV